MLFGRTYNRLNITDFKMIFKRKAVELLEVNANFLLSLQATLASVFQSHYSDGDEGFKNDLFALGLDELLVVSLEQVCSEVVRNTTNTIVGVRLSDASPHLASGLLRLSEMTSVPMEATQAARPLIVELLQARLLPAMKFWSRLPRLSDDAALARYRFLVDDQLLNARSEQLFDLITDWPSSTPAVSDLKHAIIETDARVHVSIVLGRSIDKRLLHPGAQTRDILQFYISLVYAVRYIDAHGIILSRVASPIRRYLRGRSDTIAVIVGSLLGGGVGVADLRAELDAAARMDEGRADVSGIGDTTADVTMTDAETARLAGPQDRHDVSTSARLARLPAAASDRIVDYSDPNWQPRPIDAGPNYRQTKSADVIAMLVSIFDDRATFVKALEVSTARALLQSRGYNVNQEYRNNEVLKRRFGDAALSKCDVMLQDVTDSRRVNQAVWQLLRTPDTALPANIRRKLPREPARQAASQDETLLALKPLITSRQFWPDLEGSEAPASVAAVAVGEDNKQPATLASIGPPPGGLEMKLPGSLGRAMDAYNRCFTAVRESRRLRWLSGFGSVEVSVAMRDGRNWTERVDPIKAAVLVAAGEADGGESGEGASPDFPVSKAKVMEDMEISGTDTQAKSLVDAAFAYWVSRNVLVEVRGRAGWYVECFTSPQEDGGKTST